MFRTSDIVLIAVMVSAAAMTYTIKRDAEIQLDRVHTLQAKIRTEEDTIDLLRADWSLLTQPARLQELTSLYQEQLNLENVSPHQFATIEDVPQRPLTIEDITSADSAQTVGDGTDQTMTGAIQ